MTHRSRIAALAVILCCLPAATGQGVRADSPDAAHQAPAARIYLPMAARQFSEDVSSLGDPFAPTLGNPGYDVLRYDLAFTVRITEATPSASFDATATIEIKSTRDGLDRLALDYAGPPIRSVVSAGAPLQWYVGRGNKLWVVLADPLKSGESTAFTIDYGGASTTSGPFMAGRVGTSATQVWTVPGQASGWFPANDHPSDRARFRIRVNAPTKFISVANGRLVDSADDGTTATAQFDGPEMAPGDATFQIAKYTVVEGQGANGLPLRHYLLRDADDAAPVLKVVERQLAYFGAQLGPYPFDSFGVVDAGVANVTAVPTLLLVGRNQLSARPVYFERLGGAGVAAQWFGGAVGLAKRGDSVLNTGLSQYLGVLYQARDQGPELIRSRLAALEASYAYGVTTDQALAAITPGNNGADVATNKGPWAYHALRLAMGHEAFLAALKSYFAERRGQSADLDALQRVADKASGRSLGPLFDAQFRQARTPRANLAWVQRGGQVALRVCQLTAAAQDFPLSLAIHGTGGDTAKAIHVSQPDENFRLDVSGNVATVSPDPEQALLADIIVTRGAGETPPECAALPLPALPRLAGVEAESSSDDEQSQQGESEAEAHSQDSDWAPAMTDLDDIQRLEGKPAHFGGHDLDRSDGSNRLNGLNGWEPGDPSIGDPYLPYLGNSGYDVRHYDVKLAIDPPGEHVDGDITLSIRSTMDDMDRFSLDFMRMMGERGLTVTEVTVGGVASTFERPRNTDKLWIDLPRRLARNTDFTLRVRYTGSTVPGGSGTFTGGLRFFAGPSAHAVNEPDGTRNWIPSNDHPRDKATFHFEITVPKPYVATANGVRGKVTETASTVTTVFDMPHPMSTYLATVAVAKYRTAEQVGPRGIPIVHYFQNDPADGIRVAGVTPDVLDYLSQIIGPYPFDSYGHYAAQSFGGGMENQTMTAIGVNSFTTRTPRSGHSLIAHEAAHQWFGDALSPYVWSDIWLNEGFATYFQKLWSFERIGPEPLGWSMESTRYAVLLTGADEPLSYPSVGQMFGTNTYSKGAWILHMLRRELGDEAFFKGIRAYYAEHEYGNVRDDDFQASMEKAAGHSLASWFNVWVHDIGNPIIRAAWRQDGGKVELRLCRGSELFEVPLAIAIHGDQGAVRSLTRIDSAERTLSTDVPFTTTGVTLDPDFELMADLRVLHATAATLPDCRQLEEDL